jgi:hypothetical protein
MMVVGQTPTPNYPAAAAWTQQDQGVEPPLGYAIDALEPVGTAQEIQASDPATSAAGDAGPAPASGALDKLDASAPSQSGRLRRPQFIRP